MTNKRVWPAAAIALAAIGPLRAGSLEPTAPPAPTLLKVPASVAKTGQTTCWNAAGSVIPCAGSGQDGAIQAGAAVGPRFTDNGNGTVKDNQTGLVWLKQASCFGAQTWTNALASANGLASGACGLTDGSTAGTWRLPNVNEMLSLIDYSRSNPALSAGHPFTGVTGGNYWTSTSLVYFPVDAWRVLSNDGFASFIDKNSALDLWPVRSGQ